MTAQISDGVIYSGTAYSIAGVPSSSLFNPKDHGLITRRLLSACWRGYVCTYKIINNTLFIDSIIAIGVDSAPPIIDVQPTRLDNKNGFEYEYRFTDQPFPFTGRLIIVNDFVDELASGGFAPAWKFKEAHEIRFYKGQLMEARDCSAQMAKIRERRAGKSFIGSLYRFWY